jgi:hypothetical protein
MMNWKKMCKEEAVADFKVLFRNLPRGTEENPQKTSVRIAIH